KEYEGQRKKRGPLSDAQRRKIIWFANEGAITLKQAEEAVKDKGKGYDLLARLKGDNFAEITKEYEQAKIDSRLFNTEGEPILGEQSFRSRDEIEAVIRRRFARSEEEFKMRKTKEAVEAAANAQA
ncbi:MAG: hypothetical protein ACKPFF_00550, partial [Planktothrix sp.]